MSMPALLSSFLQQHHVDYNILKHKPAPGPLEVAQTASIPLEHLVRSIVLQLQRHPENLLMALIPASQHLDLKKLTAFVGDHYQIVDRHTLKVIFQDCQPGVIPGLGQPFNLEMIADTQLFEAPCVYLEDGDATELIRLDKDHFLKLMSSIPRIDLCAALPRPQMTRLKRSLI